MLAFEKTGQTSEKTYRCWDSLSIQYRYSVLVYIAGLCFDSKAGFHTGEVHLEGCQDRGAGLAMAVALNRPGIEIPSICHPRPHIALGLSHVLISLGVSADAQACMGSTGLLMHAFSNRPTAVPVESSSTQAVTVCQYVRVRHSDRSPNSQEPYRTHLSWGTAALVRHMQCIWRPKVAWRLGENHECSMALRSPAEP